MTFVCISLTSSGQQIAAAWYYCDGDEPGARGLECTPVRIPGTLGPVHQKGQTAGVDSCGPQSGGGSAFNGWYPSFMSTDTRPATRPSTATRSSWTDATEASRGSSRHVPSRSTGASSVPLAAVRHISVRTDRDSTDRNEAPGFLRSHRGEAML